MTELRKGRESPGGWRFHSGRNWCEARRQLGLTANIWLLGPEQMKRSRVIEEEWLNAVKRTEASYH